MTHRLRACAGALLALLFVAMGVSAQEATRTLLRLHPHVGDTLRTLLEQQTDVSDVTPGSASSPPRSTTSSVAIYSETIVRTVQRASTIVLTIVDSAKLTSNDPHAAKQIFDAQRALEGQRLVLQLGADGTVERARDARGALVTREVSAAIAAMPAVFPKTPVLVGEEWTREMPLPSGGTLGAKGSGRAKAVFRLDSLQRDGPIAYVSMRGAIVADSAGQGVELSGSIAGSMQVDRVRGWMTDSRCLVMLRSVVTPPAGSGLAPMRILTRVSQHLRTMDKR